MPDDRNQFGVGLKIRDYLLENMEKMTWCHWPEDRRVITSNTIPPLYPLDIRICRGHDTNLRISFSEPQNGRVWFVLDSYYLPYLELEKLVEKIEPLVEDDPRSLAFLRFFDPSY